MTASTSSTSSRSSHERFDGGWTGPLRRELLVQRPRPWPCCPTIPMQDLVVLVEQFRAGCIDLPGEPWLIEAVAGLVEAGETPEEVAAREVREETGLAVGRLEFVCRYHASPGGTSERVQVFVAEVAAPDAPAACSASRTRTRISAPMSCRRQRAFAMVARWPDHRRQRRHPAAVAAAHRERLRREWGRQVG